MRYFDDTRVETLLTVYDAKSGGQLAETVVEAFEGIKLGLSRAAAAGLLVATGRALAAGAMTYCSCRALCPPRDMIA